MQRAIVRCNVRKWHYPLLKDEYDMADEGDILQNLDAQPNGADTQPAAAIITQYVKDLSVENPSAPA